MLNNRQSYILQFINNQGSKKAVEIIAEVKEKFDKVSKPTILRDLSVLQKSGQIAKEGSGRSVFYKPAILNPLLRHIEVGPYFSIPSDQRKIKKNFDWSVFENLKNIFTKDELKHLRALNDLYLKKKNKLPQAALQKEIERLTIEFSWKSSELEGNTYTLIDTEILIKESREASGHSKEEAVMILNHKRALDYILSKQKSFKQIKISDARAIHSILIKDLGIPDDFRKILVRITGTNYQPLGNQFQIKEALEKSVAAINNEKEPPVKAFLALLLVTYIQPFVDGNKRTSRLLANALLLSHDWCPLTLRSMDSAEYKKAVLLFYEQNNFKYFKDLFINQFKFAVENYFG